MRARSAAGKASTPRDCHQGLPLVIVAHSEYADKSPEFTTKFLGIHMRALEMMQQDPVEKLLPEYLRFYVDWAGTDYRADLAALDLKNHPMYNLEQPCEFGARPLSPSSPLRRHPRLPSIRANIAF